MTSAIQERHDFVFYFELELLAVSWVMQVHPSVIETKHDGQIRESEECVAGVQDDDIPVIDDQALWVAVDPTEWQPELVVAFFEGHFQLFWCALDINVCCIVNAVVRLKVFLRRCSQPIRLTHLHVDRLFFSYICTTL